MLKQCTTNFSKIYKPRQYPIYQKGDTKKIPHLGANNIRCYHTKFSCLGSLAPVICAPLMYIILQCVQKYFNNCHRMFGTVIWVHLNQNGRSLHSCKCSFLSTVIPIFWSTKFHWFHSCELNLHLMRTKCAILLMHLF